MAKRNTAAVIALCFLTGCAAQRYRAAPIIPATTASQFESRSLADSGLHGFVEKSVGHPVSPWPPQKWDLQTLSLAALYFNPTLDIARARLKTAEGAAITAAARPNPTVDLVPGIPTPYLLTQDVLFAIETGGKRGLRVEVAKSLDQAAQFDLADSAWTVAMGVRVALLNYLMASRSLELIDSQEKARADQVAILEKVSAVGEITGFDVDLARIDLSKASVAAQGAAIQVVDAKSALATAIGILSSTLDGIEFSWPDLDTPPPPDTIPVSQIRRDAVLNRLDIRRTLAQYEASEADLRLEIAKRYPTFNIGPGYTYEERNSFFTVGFSSSLPIFNRNQGPIAEAEGRREQAAAAFLQTQAQVLEKSERALAVYSAAIKAVVQTQSLYKLQQNQLQIVQQSIRAGADYRLNFDTTQIQVSVLAQALLDALAGAQRALGDLEDSVQRPLVAGELLPINVESPVLNKAPQTQSH